MRWCGRLTKRYYPQTKDDDVTNFTWNGVRALTRAEGWWGMEKTTDIFSDPIVLTY